jgi:uncharacterized PurR-regulated membrane protein YhhQ (DUF165 family)
MIRYLAPLAYVLCIVAANWAIAIFRVVPVGFGLYAPAGVFFAGFTFTCRNLTQLTLGRRWGYLSIIVGALLSAVITDKVSVGGPLLLAWASGLTFLLSESLDALVWTKLREREWWTRAMLLGDAAGQVLDSVVFLTLAFGSLELLLGQIVGKWWTLIPAAILMWTWRAVSERRHYPDAARGSAT